MAEEEKTEFRHWNEFNWKAPDIDRGSAEFITAGIDIGSISSQAVIVADGRILAYGSLRTGSESADSARKAMAFVLEAVGDMPGDRLDYCIGTGYGRVNVPFADRTVTEIACHAIGAHFIYGSDVRTVLDVGGQDIKAIRCDAKGKVVNFLMNDKCAAGTGRGMETFADFLEVPVTEIGERSFRFREPELPAVSNTCVVYAKSEATGLLRKGRTREEVLGAYCRAMAERIYSIVERLGARAEFAVTGGMAKNRGVMDRVMSLVGMEQMTAEWDPQIAGAVGAALFGLRLCRKGKAKRKRQS